MIVVEKGFVVHVDGCRTDQVFAAVYLFVCFLHDISKYNADGITKLHAEMFHDESWKPFILELKGRRSRVTKTFNPIQCEQRLQEFLYACISNNIIY